MCNVHAYAACAQCAHYASSEESLPGTLRVEVKKGGLLSGIDKCKSSSTPK